MVGKSYQTCSFRSPFASGFLPDRSTTLRTVAFRLFSEDIIVPMKSS